MKIPSEKRWHIELARKYEASAKSVEDYIGASYDWEKAGEYWRQAGNYARAEDALQNAFFNALSGKTKLIDFKNPERKRIKDLALRVEELRGEVGSRFFKDRTSLGPVDKSAIEIIKYWLDVWHGEKKVQSEDEWINSPANPVSPTSTSNPLNPFHFFIAIFSIVLGIFFLSNNITGYTISNSNKMGSNIIGIVLFFIGIIFFLFALNKKRKKCK